MNAQGPLLALTAPASAEGVPRRRSRPRRPRRRASSRPRGGDIRRLIAELRELTRVADGLRLGGADPAVLSARGAEIERKQCQLAELVRRDPTFGRAACGAHPPTGP